MESPGLSGPRSSARALRRWAGRPGAVPTANFTLCALHHDEELRGRRHRRGETQPGALRMWNLSKDKCVRKCDPDHKIWEPEARGLALAKPEVPPVPQGPWNTQVPT